MSATETSDAAGNFQFLSLAPGPYKITAEAQGFRKHEATVTLQTNQTLNVPISLEVGAITEQTTVSATSPLVNTAETRNEMTLGTDALSTLPLAGHSYISLVTMAPGVSGLGTMGGGQPGGPGGTPGTGVDNYSTETAVDVSANGQGTVANQFIVDGLNVTSGIRQGVLNLTPNPDAIQESSIQVNTFSSEYGGGSSIQMASTTKSGSEQFHGLVSDYYNNQNMFSNTVFMAPGQKYNPFHAHNASFTVGGPIIPKQQFFFFFAYEPLRSSVSTGNQTIFFPDQQFATWAGQNYPNTFGTRILNTYLPSAATISGVSKTAADVFPGTCGTAGHERPALLDGDDRHGHLQFEQLPRRRPVLRTDRQAAEGRSAVRQRVLDEPELRRSGGDPAVLDDQPQHAAGAPDQLHAHLQLEHAERGDLRAEPDRRVHRRDR